MPRQRSFDLRKRWHSDEVNYLQIVDCPQFPIQAALLAERSPRKCNGFLVFGSESQAFIELSLACFPLSNNQKNDADRHSAGRELSRAVITIQVAIGLELWRETENMTTGCLS